MAAIFDTPLYPYRRSADQDAGAPVRHPVIIVGAGPVGLTLGIDLALRDVPVVILDDNDRVSFGSRAICFAKRQLEILDRLGCGQRFVDKGVVWSKGKVFVGDSLAYEFDLLPEGGHRRPAFINLQQYHFEHFLVDRLNELRAAGHPIELRGKNRVEALADHGDFVRLEVSTPEGPYLVEADWLVACDGANSPIRRMLGMNFMGQAFEDTFLIADVVMQAEFPTERWFWFDPPFNPGQSALLHKQPDNVWRIDLQLGRGIDKEKEKQPERVVDRLKAMLGPERKFDLEWVSIYNFQCRRMERFRKGRVIFAGDAAHQVSPFGARGANSGLQDAENLAWKLALVQRGLADEALLHSYEEERIMAADENIQASTRSTGFITPATPASRVLRDAVLQLARHAEFARPLVNSGRLSVPCTYDGAALIGPDELPGGPDRTRPGAPCCDAQLGQGYLLDRLGGAFTLLAINADLPSGTFDTEVPVETLALSAADDPHGYLAQRYLGDAPQAVYLVRPDQHVVARWDRFDHDAVDSALTRAIGRSGQ